MRKTQFGKCASFMHTDNNVPTNYRARWPQLPAFFTARAFGHSTTILFVLLLTVLLSGCIAAPAVQLLAKQTRNIIQQNRDVARSISSSVSPAQPTLDLAEASTNRLLVVGVDGNLFTVAPDSSGRFPLTSNASSQQSYTQPTWSATGERIAWTSIERAGGTRGALVTIKANGTAQTRTETAFPPFYLYWSPDDSKVAYLGNWLGGSGGTIALHVADIVAPITEGNNAEPTAGAPPIAVGQPFYFSWAPSSDRMIAHVGNREVILFDLVAQKPTVLVEDSANFAAPQWVSPADSDSRNSSLLYGIKDDSTAQLVLSDSTGANEEFVTYLARQDFVSFSMNATGNQIAYIETTEQIGFNSFGPLFLYDREQEVFEQLSSDPALAFFWSPNGAALYFLTVEPTAQQLWLRVNVWDGTTVQQFARFVPSPSFLRNYLPFADQYMQSIRFWSPDSSAIVYAGQAENGTAGIWVQPVTAGAEPQLVVAGTFATWSPK